MDSEHTAWTLVSFLLAMVLALLIRTLGNNWISAAILESEQVKAQVTAGNCAVANIGGYGYHWEKCK